MGKDNLNNFDYYYFDLINNQIDYILNKFKKLEGYKV
jgi:hypothetical protein